MGKRLVAFFSFFILLAGGLIVRILFLSLSSEYVEAGNSQSSYTVTVASSRGKIYDCKMRSLAGGKAVFKAVVEPSAATTAKLMSMKNPDLIFDIEEKLKANRPFLIDVPDAGIDSEGIRVFKTVTRYAPTTPAAHVVGYMNGDGEGVSGIERAYDSLLQNFGGTLTARYTVNARGSSIKNTEPVITDTLHNSDAGVVLTIDTDLQLIAERAAKKYLKSGAIVLLEAETGKIRACVSYPDFSPKNVADYLDGEDSPLLNKAFASYDVGSVFKLLVAATALEDGISPDIIFSCGGHVTIGSNTFRCSRRAGHGNLDMRGAIAQSCNCYFIELSKQIGYEKLLAAAKKLGFGKKVQLGDNYFTSSGNLPDKGELALPSGLANFSFGQGTLQANPVQVASLILTIANGGEYLAPSIVEGVVNQSGEFIKKYPSSPKVFVWERETANDIKNFMVAATQEGTAKPGAPNILSSAAKTSTAETGMKKEGKKVLQAWYAGFFPAENPRYVCVVLAENGESGGATAGPVYKYIADNLTKLIFEEYEE
ncbi:MAG: penicillin-binding protein 2 [Oscillospiraceae bacterium]|nr:penicillin-binding protein 2 [Oscillospiraceae bacterium]